MLDPLMVASACNVWWFFLGVNCFIFVVSVGLCWGIGRYWSRKRIFDRWEPLRAMELGAAGSSILLNAGISVLGWWIWTQGGITIRPSSMVGSLFDGVVMVLVMDFGMYVFHRLAHWPRIYEIVHRFHHRHEATNPISLFVLHPVEVVGFGGLMIVFLMLYPMTLAGLMGYLSLNVIFGTLGHCGVEPFPRAWRQIPLLRLVGTSTFHAEHHEHPKYNFGFYTLLWDKLFRTLDPEYARRFDQRD